MLKQHHMFKTKNVIQNITSVHSCVNGMDGTAVVWLNSY